MKDAVIAIDAQDIQIGLQKASLWNDIVINEDKPLADGMNSASIAVGSRSAAWTLNDFDPRKLCRQELVCALITTVVCHDHLADLAVDLRLKSLQATLQVIRTIARRDDDGCESHIEDHF